MEDYQHGQTTIQSTNGDGSSDYMLVESSNRPNHKSYYWQATKALYEAFDFATNIYKYAATVTATGYSVKPRSAGNRIPFGGTKFGFV